MNDEEVKELTGKLNDELRKTGLDRVRFIAILPVPKDTDGQSCPFSQEARCSKPANITCAGIRCPVWLEAIRGYDYEHL